MRHWLVPALALTACAACTPTPPPAATAPAPVAAAAPADAPPPMPARPPGPMPKYVPPSRMPSAVPSGTYMVEPAHTQIMFSVLHFGVNPYMGTFSGASGTLTVDAGHPANDQLDVSVPIASVMTTSTRLNGELTSKMFFDAATYPTMTFKSTKIIPVGKTGARVMGDLTMHGVTRPITLNASFVAAGMNPMMHKLTVGFTAMGTIKRSDFGVNVLIPAISDETKITISAAFVQ